MQHADAVKNSKLKTGKKVFGWLLATVAAVPITKWAESQLNLSFFSPAISGLWGWLEGVASWLNMTASMPLWLLIALAVWALLMSGAMIWGIYYAEGKLIAADKELREAHAKLRALSPLKAQLKSLQEEVEAHKAELKSAQEKIGDLQAPKVTPLTDEQVKVIAVIAAYDNVGRRCQTNALPAPTELALLQTDGALDVLVSRKLIQFVYLSYGRAATLTARGRAHVLSPDFIPPSLPRLSQLALKSSF